MRTLLAALALGLVPLTPGSSPDGAVEVAIDQEMAASGVPGLSYAVVADGEVTSAGARGVVRAGGDTAVTPDTPFLIGSISKSFTALAVMQLVEAGEVDLGAGIAQYLDVFSGRPAAPVTVRQLLSHTSGFSTLQGNSNPELTGDGGSQPTDALERVVADRADEAPAYTPGERWEYSNLNYQVLGRLVEVVSGQSFQDYLSARVLEPIGMEQSFVADGEVHEAMASGHTPWFGTKRPIATGPTDRATAPQGGVVSSANDLALYLGTMMNGQDDVLSAAGKAQMMRPAGGAASFYGFGWFVDSGDGRVWHSGSTPGVETLATMLPSRSTAVVVLVDGGSGVGFGETSRLRDAVTAAALGLPEVSADSRLPQKALFLGLVLLPIVYLGAMVWAWRHRAAIRAKTGIAGRFSLWFPLLTTGVAAWVILGLVPRLFGSPLANLQLYVPDFVLALVATAVTGVLWAAFRLGVAYTGRKQDGPYADGTRRELGAQT